jgi:hypothetical protein
MTTQSSVELFGDVVQGELVSGFLESDTELDSASSQFDEETPDDPEDEVGA